MWFPSISSHLSTFACHLLEDLLGDSPAKGAEAAAAPAAPEPDSPEDVDSLDGEPMTECDSSSDDERVDMDDGNDMEGMELTDVPPFPDPFAMVEIDDDDDDDCPEETVVVSNPDGSSTVYAVDPNRNSQIEEYRLPALATKIAEHPPPQVCSTGMFFVDVAKILVWWSIPCTTMLFSNVKTFVFGISLCPRWCCRPQAPQAAADCKGSGFQSGGCYDHSSA